MTWEPIATFSGIRAAEQENRPIKVKAPGVMFGAMQEHELRTGDVLRFITPFHDDYLGKVVEVDYGAEYPLCIESVRQRGVHGIYPSRREWFSPNEFIAVRKEFSQ